MLPAEIKRELLNLTDRVEMADALASTDPARYDAIMTAVERRLDQIEASYPDATAGFTPRLGALRQRSFGR